MVCKKCNKEIREGMSPARWCGENYHPDCLVELIKQQKEFDKTIESKFLKHPES